MGTTRLYFATTSPAVSPTFGGPGWFYTWDGTGSAFRGLLTPTKSVTALVASGAISNAGSALGKNLGLQATSEPLAAQTIPGTTFLKGQCLFTENAAGNNIDLTWLAVYTVSNDGATYHKTLLSLNAYGSTTEFSVLSTYTDRILCVGATYDVATYGSEGGDIVITDGDRLVVEVGAGSAAGGSAGSYRMKYGDTGTDLPDADEAQTTDGVPWIEMDYTLVFQAGGTVLDPLGQAGFFGI